MKQTMQKSRLMKTVMAVVLIAMLFSALPTLAAREAENYILNGSFESGKEDWLQNNGGGTIQQYVENEAPAGGGTNYITLTRTDTLPSIQQGIFILPAGTFRMSLWYKCPGTESTGTAAYYKVSKSETLAGATAATSTTLGQGYLKGTENVWTKAEIDFTVSWTDGSADHKVWIILYGYKANETVCYDLVSFEPFEVPILKNGGFDESFGATNWSYTAKANIETSGNEKYLALNGKPSASLAQQGIAIPAGTRIRLTFKFKTNTEGTKPYVSINAKPGLSSGETRKKDYSTGLAGGTTEWTAYTIIADVYNSVASKKMEGYWIVLRGNATNDNPDITCYYDDVCVEVANQAFIKGANQEATSFVAGDTLTASWNRISALEGGSTGQEELMLVAALYETKNGVKRIVSIAPVVKDALGAPDTQGTDGGTFYIAKVKELTTDLVIPETLDPDATYIAKMMCLSGTTLIPYEKTWVIYN